MEAPDAPLILSVEFQLTQADLEAYLRYRQWSTPEGRKKLLPGMAGLAVFGAVLGLVSFGRPDWLGIVIMAAAMALAYPFFVWLQQRTLARNSTRQPEFHLPTTLVITPEALFLRRGGTEVRREWSSVQGVAGTVNHLFLFLGSLQAFVIPRRAFGSQAAAEKYLITAREYWLAAKDRTETPLPLSEIEAALGPERLGIEYELTDRDYRNFQWYHLQRQKRGVLGIAAMAVGVAVLIWVLSGSLVAALGAPLLLFATLAVLMWVQRRALRSNPGHLGRHWLYLSPSALWGRTPGLGDARLDWNGISEVVANAEHILLFRGPNFAIMVPRRAFPTPEEADRFLLRACEWQAPHVTPPPTKRK